MKHHQRILYAFTIAAALGFLLGEISLAGSFENLIDVARAAYGI